ncbi:MAG: hypothetical protein ACKO43_05575, partial [Alphaproteobacteria bacterium]
FIMANNALTNALTREEILSQLKELNPQKGFGVRMFMGNWGESFNYPDDIEEAAREIYNAQETYGPISSIKYDDFDKEVKVKIV